MSKLKEALMGDVGAFASAPTVTAQGTTGSTSSTYVIATTCIDGSVLRSAATACTTGNATPSSSNFNRITWAAVTHAVSYAVYRTAGGATQGKIATVLAAASRQVDDVPLAGGSETITALTKGIEVSALEESYVHVSGTFVGTWIVEVSFDGGVTYATFDTGTAGKLTAKLPPCDHVRGSCGTFTSGHIVMNVSGRDTDRLGI